MLGSKWHPKCVLKFLKGRDHLEDLGTWKRTVLQYYSEYENRTEGLYERMLADFCHLLSLGHLSSCKVFEEDCPLQLGALTLQSRHQ
jgi:hypothetical protein